MDREIRVIRKGDRSTQVAKGNDKLFISEGYREIHVKQVHQTYGDDAVRMNSYGEVSSGVGDGTKVVTSVRLFTSEINLKAPSTIELTAPLIRITGNVQIIGNLVVAGSVVAAAAVVGGRPV
jgi:phage baseplate assembly protein gpV